MYAQAQIPATCGELAQGLIGGRFLHLTCPIDAWVTASAYLTPGSGRIDGLADRPKAARAVNALLDLWSMAGCFDIRFHMDNPLPSGKGMATSTADICAAVYAVARALGRELTPAQMGPIAVAVEPSDGLFYPGIAVFDHRSGTWGKTVGMAPVPPLHILAFDLGGEVDTIEFNNRVDLLEANRQKEAAVRQAFAMITRGLRCGDPRRIGEGATLSARANQGILPKEALEEIISGVRAFGAVGVNVAHSGTVLGVIVPEGKHQRLSPITSWVESRFPHWNRLGCYRLVSGGPRFADASRQGREAAL
ncbi:GHMP kinase [Heliobacterium gestii]|uniref:GHMP kinase n=1 Tax=Heliomicrobium gestii TaxID=2699 RepID=A0A845LDY7_HELGE|nr:GHMP kinase [Heliomicrobium gestii]MBM7867216.1 L-threonine kinase [Heliomicrobium gestii]MZP43771.1 GHMP kinase [Heliomicrobium gestii]